MTATLVYALLLATLVVRLRRPDAALPEPAHPVPGEPVWLVTLHHALFYVILFGSPIERAVGGSDGAHRALGALLFALGVGGYRAGAVALGDALSPFIEPRPSAQLVTAGPYHLLRHPMYLGQALIAVGAPLTLGCRYVLAVAVPAVLVLAARALLEEAALARTFPEYSQYASRTKRVVPFVY